MTRIDSVRHAADVTKDSVRHAAEVAAPYASTARDGAVHYAQQAGTLAREQYDAHLADRVGQARGQAWAAVPPKAADAVETAARRTRKGARAAADYTVPRVGTAVAATRSVAGPAKDEVVLRGAAALHALRGQVTADEIDGLIRKRLRRERSGRVFRGLVVIGLAGGAAYAAYKWWSKQANPDWLVEPTEPTEATETADRASLNGSGTLTMVDPLDQANGSPNGTAETIDRVDGSPDAALFDPEVEAKQADADRPEDEGRGGGPHP